MTRPLDTPPDRLGDEGSGTVNSLGLIALAITLALLLAGVGAARTAAVWRLPSLFSSRESVPRAPLPCGCKPSQT